MTATRRIRLESLTTFALLAAGLSVTTIGLIALFGWMLDAPVLTMWKIGTQPMAPSTAGLSILFGAALCLAAQTPPRRVAVLLVTLFGWVGAMATLLLFALRLLNVYGSAELLGLRITGTVGDAPIGYISPITAFCFLLANGSLLASLSHGDRGSWRSWLAWGFGGLVLLVSYALLLTHAFGTPLLFDKIPIQPALNTSLIMLIMGLALLVLAARYTVRPAAQSDADAVSLLPYFLIFVVFAAGTLAVTYDYYRETERRFRQQVESQLLTISELKSDELVRWRMERLWDGDLSQNIAITTAVRQLLETPHSVSAQREMQDLLGKYLRYISYDRVFLLDAKGITRMSVPDTAESTGAILAETAVASLRMGQVTLQDFYRDKHDQRVHLALMVPILDQQDGNRPLGVVALRIDPSIYLYPHIKRWPAPSASAETLLVRREGTDVLYLNDLRFRANAALTLRLPLTSNTELPAVKAVSGQRGIVDGVDYRGMPVIAAVRAVPDSPWYIVSRLNTAEAYAPLRERMWLTLLLVSVLLSGVGVLLILLWRQQRLLFYRRQIELNSSLRESEERFSIIASSAQDTIIILDEAGNIAFWNKAAESMFGYAPEEVLGHNLHTMLTPLPFREAHFRAFPHFQKTGQGALIGETLEIAGLRKDGSEFPLELSLSAKQVKGAWQSIGILRDITERKQAEEKLHLAASVFTHAHEGIIITAADGAIIDVNDAFSDITGYSRDEVLGQNPRLLKSDRHEQEFYVALWRDLIEQGCWSGEIWNRRKDGEVSPYMLTISTVQDAQVETRKYVSLYSDIGPLKEHEYKLERSAHYDALTSLPNRVLLADRLHQGMVQTRRQGHRLAVIFLDLDGFKVINDKHGHEAGDQLLIAVATRMKQILREGDTLARLGGDEFVAVLLDSGDSDASVPMLTRLLAAAAQPVQYGDITLQISASLGVTFYTQAEDIDADQLLR